MTKRSAKSLASVRRWLRWSRACAVIAVPAAILGWSSNASAQGWLADRKYTEGAGIRTGDLELHPGIGGEVGYDTNWYLRSHTEGANIVNGAPRLPPRDAAIFRLTPSFYVSTLGAQRTDAAGMTRSTPRLISFRGGASATARAFIGREMSRQHNVGFNGDMRLDVAHGRPIGMGVWVAYNRLIQPQVLADPNLSFNRSDIRTGAEVIAIPGGGTLDMRVGYQFNAALFEQSNGVPYTNLTHEILVKNRWRFRPRTALFSDTSLRFINYPNAERALNYLNDSTPLRTRLGLTGLLTHRFGALVAAGYGATFFKNPQAFASPQYNSINAQVEGTFYLGQGNSGTDEPGQATLLLSTISLGFLRDFQNSLLGNFYNTNRVYGRIEYAFGGRSIIRFDVFGEQLNYPPVFYNAGGVPTQVTGDFSNFRAGGGLFAEYRLSSSFGINTTIDYIQQFSDTQIPGAAAPGAAGVPTGVFDLNYRRFQAFAGARYFF